MKYSVIVIVFHWTVNLSAQTKLPLAYNDTLFFRSAGGYLVPSEQDQANGYSLVDSFNRNIHTKKIMYIGTHTTMIEFECYDSTYANIDVEAIPIFSVRHGRYNEWFANGVQKLSGFYSNGKREGIFKTFSENGSICKIEEWKKGIYQFTHSSVNNPDSIYCYNVRTTYESLDIISYFSQFMSNELKYPRFTRKKSIEGTVYVAFVVIADGSLKDIKVIKGVEKHLDEEAERVVKSIPKWRPSLYADVSMRFRFILPIKFKLK